MVGQAWNNFNHRAYARRRPPVIRMIFAIRASCPPWRGVIQISVLSKVAMSLPISLWRLFNDPVANST